MVNSDHSNSASNTLFQRSNKHCIIYQRAQLIMPLSFMPVSAFEHNELCLFPLSPFPICIFPILNKMNFALFLYAPFRFRSFPFLPHTGSMKNANYAGFLYASFLASSRFGNLKANWVFIHIWQPYPDWFAEFWLSITAAANRSSFRFGPLNLARSLGLFLPSSQFALSLACPTATIVQSAS